VRGHTTAGAFGRPAGHRERVALDHEVQLVRAAAEQQVAHGAADDVHRVLAVERGDGGWPPQAFEHVPHAGHLRA
jgi:hypothetical protein